MKQYIHNQLQYFDGTEFSPVAEDYLKAVLSFASWFVPALLFVLWSINYFPETEFFSKAINEGKAPNFWNLIGSLGLFLFGICLAFPNNKTLILISTKVLLNAYAIGNLTLGLVTGQLLFLPFNTLPWWQVGLFSGGVSIALGLNLLIWYVAFLVSKRSAFLAKVSKLSFGARSFLSLITVTVVIYTFTNA
ncbi:hypothetical protein [Vibrio cholerae]|uniref:hypothetical protein n=3 Tax=Vibrio cholerae TaxID=666 RepID=UPI002934ACB2|nr:hypothetical protein [Vibrio cholerae]MDV2362419.1 hypothetical protein [Vibrio cholerae]